MTTSLKLPALQERTNPRSEVIREPSSADALSMHYEPIRCVTCGCVAIGKDEGVRAGFEEHEAMLAEIDQRRKCMRAEGEDPDKVGQHFDGECAPNEHDFEPIAWLLMLQVKRVSESVGRWPTLDELKASALKMIDATPPEVRARGYVVVASSDDQPE